MYIIVCYQRRRKGKITKKFLIVKYHSAIGGIKLRAYQDKPHYVDIKKEDKDQEDRDMIIEKVKLMLKTQSFGVLATKGEEECYTSLISFASDKEFKTLIFATPINTKKYRFIEKDESISILIDNRSNNEKNINDIGAITSIGAARILEDKKEIEKCSKILVDKHSYLDDFIDVDSTAIVLVDVKNYSYVSSFQEVVEWTP